MENPPGNAKDFFNQDDYDRLVKEGVTDFAEYSSLPVPDDPDTVSATKSVPDSSTVHPSSAPSTPITPKFPQKGGISRRGFLWGLIGAAVVVGGSKVIYELNKEQSPPMPTAATKPTAILGYSIQTTIPTVQVASKPAVVQVPTLLPSIETKPSPTRVPEAIISEQDAWKRVLGADVDIKPLPAYITDEVKKNLETLGFELQYLPALNLESLAVLSQIGEKQYLRLLQNRYPNWRAYEQMSDPEKMDHRLSRNLAEPIWKDIISKQADFPNLPGQWLAVEKLLKPDYGSSYQTNQVSQTLNFQDRFNVSWDNVKIAVEREKNKLLAQMKLNDKANIRLLEVSEWNLLGNRNGWGATKSYEWTNTLYKSNTINAQARLMIGRSIDGGAAAVNFGRPELGVNNVGFRLAVILSP